MNKKPLRFFLIIVFLGTVCSVVTLYAQQNEFYDDWRWSHFTTKSGLPSDIVEDVLETNDSTVWAATAKGLAWYDGFRWHPIIVDSLYPEQRVRKMIKFNKKQILIILNGKLYLGDQNGFKKDTLIYKTYNRQTISNAFSLEGRSIIYAYYGLDSNLIFVVKNGTISFVKSIKTIYSKNTVLWSNAFRSDGTLRNKDYEWDSILTTFNRFSKPITLRDIAQNKNGEIVLAVDAPQQFIGVWEYKNGKLLPSQSERTQPIRTLDISDNAEVLTVYESGQVHIRQNGEWNNISPLPRQMANILSVKYRSNNDIWFATEIGLFYYRRSNSQWSKNDKNEFADENNVVFELFKSVDGDLWQGTMKGVEIQNKNGTKKSITHINGVKLNLITGINQDEHKNIWICSGSGFIGAFQWDGRRWHSHQNNLGGVRFHKIRKDRFGQLWFLSLGEKNTDPAGYILNNGRFIRIDSLYKLPSNRIYSFAQSKSGMLLIGTSKGLIRIKNGETKYWGMENYLNQNPKVYSLAVDSSDNIWFSTFSPHLGKISQNDSIVWVWKKEEVYEYSQKIWDLSFDALGVLWLATTKGLFSYRDSTWINHSAESGYYIRELRVVLPAGDSVLIGGHGIGMQSLYRSKNNIPISLQIQKPIIESYSAYCNWEVLSYWGRLPETQMLTRYKIDGKNWSEWSIDRSVLIKDLRIGAHQLFVQAKNSQAFDPFDAKEIKFEIEPPYYLRITFIFPILLLLFTIAVFISRYYKIQNKHNQFIVQQRTQIANDLHDEVGSSLGSIALISQRLQRNSSLSQNMKEDLAFMSQTAIQTSEFLRDIVWYINPKYDTFSSLESRLKEISTIVLKDISVEYQVINITEEDQKMISIRRSIILIFKEILHNVIKHSKATEVTIKFSRTQDLFELYVRDNGVGFIEGSQSYGNGLQSLKRRADNISAILDIQSKIGVGTEISIKFKNNVNT